MPKWLFYTMLTLCGIGAVTAGISQHWAVLSWVGASFSLLVGWWLESKRYRELKKSIDELTNMQEQN